MPQIKTRGKKPGITLSKSEQTRWQATIDDLRVVIRNTESESPECKLARDAAIELEALLKHFDGATEEKKPAIAKTA